MKYIFYIFFFLFCAATSVTAQTVSQVRSQSTNPTYTPSGAVTEPPLCYNRTTHHLWGYAGGYWYDLTSTPYVDLDPSPTNEKIVSFSVVAGVLRINENGIFYNVPINDIIAAANISSASPTITVTNVGGIVTVTSTDPDENATNELQNLSLAGQTLSISSGNSVALPVVGVTAGTGVSTSTVAGVTTVTNTSPDQTVILNGGGATTVTGTYPNFTVTTPLSLDNDPTNECNTSVTVNAGNLEITDPCGTQSVAVTNIAPVQAITAGTGISTSMASGTVTVTNTSPDQTVTVTGAGINTVTGTYPNFTVTGTEVDGDIANECNTAFAVTVDSLKITDNCGTLGVPLSAFGTPTLADNGLKMVGDTVHLGGDLHQNTSISQLGYNLTIDNVHPSGDVSQIYQGDNYLGFGIPAVGQAYTTPTGTNSYAFSTIENNYMGVENANLGATFRQANTAANKFNMLATRDGTNNTTQTIYADSLIVDVQGASHNTFAIYENSVKSTAYPQTRDDSGTTPPVNFLYTDANGVVQSAPTALIAPDLCAQIQGLPLSTPAPTDKIVYFSGAVVPSGFVGFDFDNAVDFGCAGGDPTTTYIHDFQIQPGGQSAPPPAPIVLTDAAAINAFINSTLIPAYNLVNSPPLAVGDIVWQYNSGDNTVTVWYAPAVTLYPNNFVIGDALGSCEKPVPTIPTTHAAGAGCFLGDAPAAAQDTTAWRLTGNAGTDGGATNFLGTTDAQDLVLKTNGVEIARFKQQGNATIGSDLTSVDPTLIAPTANNLGAMAFQSGQATGVFSTAFHTSTASGDGSMTWGIPITGVINNLASGAGSTVFGEENTASGILSTAFGRGNTSPSVLETTLGVYSTNYTPTNSITDRLFTIGNGNTSSSRNNALTLWKDGRSMWNGDIAKTNTWIGVNGTNSQNFINVTTPTGALAAISTEHTPSGNYAVLGSNAGNSGIAINNTKQFAFTTTAGTTSTALGATTTIGNYGNTGFLFGSGGVANSTVQVSGSLSTNTLLNAAALTLDATHHTIFHTGGAVTYTLPAASTCIGREYVIANHGTGNITFSIAITVANGVTNNVLSNTNGSNNITIQSDGVTWRKTSN